MNLPPYFSLLPRRFMFKCETQSGKTSRAIKTLFGVAWAATCMNGCGGGSSNSPSAPGSDRQSSVVFESNRDGDFEILRMNQNGQSVTRVTDNTVSDSQPSVSQDGQRIVFVSNRAGNNEIFVIDVQGTRQLTNNVFDDTQPEISPDGRRVVFRSNRNGTSDLFLYDLVRRTEIQLTSSFELEQNPTWITSNRILFSSNLDGVFFQLYEINASGSDVKPLLESEEFDQVTPSASPNGKQVAFVSDKEGNADIFLFDLSTKSIMQLTSDQRNNNRPVFSPDGQQIFFSSNRTGNDDIYSMNLDGSEVRNLTNNPAIDRAPKIR